MSPNTTPAYIRRLRITGFVFFLPALIYLIVFLLGPIVTALIFSFTKYTILSPPKFAGLRNYARIFSMPYVFPLAVTAVIWRLLYRPFGLIDQFTTWLGIGLSPGSPPTRPP